MFSIADNAIYCSQAYPTVNIWKRNLKTDQRNTNCLAEGSSITFLNNIIIVLSFKRRILVMYTLLSSLITEDISGHGLVKSMFSVLED